MLRRILLVPLRLIGSALRAILIAVLAVSMIAGGIAVADYSATQGSGTTFASVVISLKHYMAMVVCDPTNGESQCAAVNSSNQLATAATQAGTWTMQPGNTPNTTPWLASINQGGNTATVDANSNLHVAAQGVAPGTAVGSITGSVVMCDPINALPAYSNGLANWRICDLNGRAITKPYANPENSVGSSSVTFSAGTAQTVLPAGTGSNKTYLTDWACYNNSASAITVTLSDAQATIIFLPANGGNNKSWEMPLVSTVAATAITATPSAANASAGCTMRGYVGL